MLITDRRSFLTTSLLAGAHVLTAHVESLPSNSLEQQAESFIQQNDFQGVILVARGSKVLYSHASGLSDRAAGKPIDITTIFQAGSISKWIASITTLKLVDQDKLRLDTPISTYLPYLRSDVGDHTTLAHLLSHTSGVPNDIIPALKADPQLSLATITQKEAVQRYASGAPRFTPGSDWDYSHSNWILVKAIVERASGMPYAQLAGQTIWEPLGLKRSGIFNGLAPAAPNVALSYRSNDAKGAPVEQRLPAFLEMAGGYYCSAEDLLALMHAVTTGRLLSNKATQALFQVRWANEHYALGCRVDTHTFGGSDQRFIAEDGSNAGFKTVAYRILNTGETCIILNNTTLSLNLAKPFALQLLETVTS